jgi:hypothetical protein
MAQAIHHHNRFHNLSHEQLANALGDADLAIKAHEAECKALKDEFKGRSLLTATGEHFSVTRRQLDAEWFAKDLGETLEKAGDRNPYWSLRTHKQITALKSHAELGKAVSFFHRTLNIQTDDYEDNVAPVEEAANEAASNRIEAAYAVFDTVPTTLAGMRTKIDWAMSVDHVTGLLSDTDECLGNFLDTLYESARLIAVQS